MNREARKIVAGLLLSALLLARGDAEAALCGDASGDGFVNTGDALQTLKMAVASGYDRRADVATPFLKISATDALATLRASVEKRIPACQGSAVSRVVLTTAPYDFIAFGGIGTAGVAPPHGVDFRGGAISGDAVIRTPLGIPVVVNRKGNNSLQLLDVDDEDLPNIKECSVSDGEDSNPQDVVFVSANKGYVTPYELGRLLVIDPQVLLDPENDPACTGMITDRIDLSAFDPDGIPDLDQMVVVGDELFVSLQLLDRSHKPSGDSLLAVIDTSTDTVKTTIPLAFRNPFAMTQGLPYDEFEKLLYVGGPGRIEADVQNGFPEEVVLNDGGIEAIDPVTKTSKGLILSGADIHANIFDYVIVGRKRAYAIIADLQSNSVVEIDLAKREIRETLLSSSLALITDIEMTELGELWVAYRGEDPEKDPPGLRVFSVVTNDAIDGGKPIAVGQAPFTLSFLP